MKQKRSANLLKQTFRRIKSKNVIGSSKEDGNKGTDVISTQSSRKEQTYPLFMAKYDFSSPTSNELNFKKGDLFYIINNKENWWYAKAKCSGKEGYIPSNYLEEYKSLEGHKSLEKHKSLETYG